MYRSDSDGLQAARAQLVSYSARLLDDGLAVGSAGNMSVRAGDTVAITPSGISYAEMRPEDICLVALDGTELAGTARKRRPPRPRCTWPSTRRPRPAPWCTRTRPRSSRCPRPATELPAIHYAITGLGGPVRVAPYVRFGSAGLAEAAVEALDGRSAVILRNHGAVTYGRDLAQAYDRALLLEWLARTYRLALSYGEPAILSAAELDEVTRRIPPPPLRRAPRGRPRGERLVSAWPLGQVTVMGACILDVLGRPVETIPPGQGSVRLAEIRATAAGTAAGPAVDLAKLGASVRVIGALGDDLLGDIVDGRDGPARRGHRRAGPQKRGPDLGHHPAHQAERRAARAARPRARRGCSAAPTSTWSTSQDSRALLIGAPDALAGLTGEELADVAKAARSQGALVAVDVLHPGRPQDLERLAPLLARPTGSCRTPTSCSPSPAEPSLAGAINDVVALGTRGVAVTLGADGCLVATRQARRARALPALKVDVVDTTGCGDGFTAGMLAGLLLGAPGRRGLARRRLRLPGRHRPGLGRRDRGPGPGTGLPEPHAAGPSARPDQGRMKEHIA